MTLKRYFRSEPPAVSTETVTDGRLAELHVELLRTERQCVATTEAHTNLADIALSLETLQEAATDELNDPARQWVGFHLYSTGRRLGLEEVSREVSVESISSVLVKVIEALKKVAARMLEYVKSFIEKMLNGHRALKTRIGQLRKQVEGASKVPNGDAVTMRGFVYLQQERKVDYRDLSAGIANLKTVGEFIYGDYSDALLNDLNLIAAQAAQGKLFTPQTITDLERKLQITHRQVKSLSKLPLPGDRNLTYDGDVFAPTISFKDVEGERGSRQIPKPLTISEITSLLGTVDKLVTMTVTKGDRVKRFDAARKDVVRSLERLVRDRDQNYPTEQLQNVNRMISRNYEQGIGQYGRVVFEYVRVLLKYVEDTLKVYPRIEKTNP